MPNDFLTPAQLAADSERELQYRAVLQRMAEAGNAMHGRCYGDRSAQDRRWIAAYDARQAKATARGDGHCQQG